MNIVNKLIPAFLKRYDQKLLATRPIFWVLKLHYLVYWQTLFSAACILFSYFLPQSLGNFPTLEFILGVFGIANTLIYLIWLFATNQFDLRTRNISKPRYYEQARVGSNLLAGILVAVNIYASFYILEYKTTRIVAPLTHAQWAKLESAINNFQYNDDNYARGYFLENHYDSLLMFRVEDTVHISIDTILKKCTQIGQLNEKYGDGKLYTGKQVYEHIRDTSYNRFFYDYGYNSYTDHLLTDLYANNYKISDAFDEIEGFWGYQGTVFKTAPIILIIIVFIIGVIMLLIYNFKYFGIYQIITAVLTPTLLFLIVVAAGFVLEQFMGIDFNKNLPFYAFLDTALVLLIISKGYAYKYRSKKRIVVVQTLAFLIPAILIVFFTEVIDNYYRCPLYLNASGEAVFYSNQFTIPNPDYHLCREKQSWLEFSWLIGLSSLFAFVLLPIKLKLLYRLYFLPAIK